MAISEKQLKRVREMEDHCARIVSIERALDAAALRALLSERERLRKAMPNPSKLELLATWFDECHDSPNTEVQDDLRQWAASIRAALASTHGPEED